MLQPKFVLRYFGLATQSLQVQPHLAQLKRNPESLVEFLFRDNSFPNGCFLLTGTGIVPPDDFTLQSGDEIRITIDSIGTLVNLLSRTPWSCGDSSPLCYAKPSLLSQLQQFL